MESRSRDRTSMPSKSRSVLKEQALAAWHFQPSNTAKNQNADVAGILQASLRDMEILTRALERELNSRPEEGVINRISNDTIAENSTNDADLSSMSSCGPGIPSHAFVETKTSLEVLDFKAGQFEAPTIRTSPAEALSRSCNNQRSIPVMNNLFSKRLSRRGNRAPIKIMTADPADFQAMVEQIPVEKNSSAAPSLLKPQPKRPGRVDSVIIPSVLPMLDSSSLGLPVAINSLFGTRPNYLHPTAFCNSLAENSVYSVGTATPNSHISSIGIDTTNNWQSKINAFTERDLWN